MADENKQGIRPVEFDPEAEGHSVDRERSESSDNGFAEWQAANQRAAEKERRARAQAMHARGMAERFGGVGSPEVNRHIIESQETMDPNEVHPGEAWSLPQPRGRL